MEGTSSSGSEAARRSASRQHAGSTTSTPVSPSYEERTIILAQGLQYLNHQLPERYRTPEYLQSRYRGRDRLKIWGNLEVLADGTTVYTSRRQVVRFVIRKVTTKSQFKDALETSGAHVIYGGHARYGR